MTRSTWSYEATKSLVQVLGVLEVLSQLSIINSSTNNLHICLHVSKRLAQRGHNKMVFECRTKSKSMRAAF